MQMLRILLIVLEALCSVMLITLILLQKSKGQGLGVAFGGTAGESFFGARAGNVLTKWTVYLAIFFLVNTVVLGLLFTGGGSSSVMGPAEETRGEVREVEKASPEDLELPEDAAVPAE
ncbi:preprotein translocase subunit SecG [Kiritimatiella glycovorans]|uniref:Protein-export membrane protein SecG n=1 Tax=Kiritimatiella glycovorans TaxID=1307763 RepID=A0A0G3EBK7_9BACT|nr:preprotein translocase subunit SecG [Kiritimatiella glycovorans]AKJ63831.1 hypothetical protein L21SP4_00560 [Kiritimatiella glycovorans]